MASPEEQLALSGQLNSNTQRCRFSVLRNIINKEIVASCHRLPITVVTVYFSQSSGEGLHNIVVEEENIVLILKAKGKPNATALTDWLSMNTTETQH